MNEYIDLVTTLKILTKNDMKIVEDKCIQYLENGKFKCLCKFISYSSLSPRLIYYILNKSIKMCGCCLYKTRPDKLWIYLNKLEYYKFIYLTTNIN